MKRASQIRGEELSESQWLRLAPRAVFSSPHQFRRRSSARIMWLVSLCLLPAALWGVWLYGWPALRVLLLSIFSCAATEALCNQACAAGAKNQLYHNRPQPGRWETIAATQTLDDGSAVLSGLLLGMNLPPLAPWYLPLSGGIFAMAVCKWSFGGLGANWINPALAGRAFLSLSFVREMGLWSAPRSMGRGTVLSGQGFDAGSSASPLGRFKEQLLLAQNGGAGEPGISQVDLPDLLDLLLGFQSGSIGEVATLLLLLGGLTLWGLRIINGYIPLALLGSFALLTWIFGGLYQDLGLFRGAVLFHLFSGGLMLGAWFMATDYSGCPKMPMSKIIFGVGCGGLTFLVRFYGSYPEGVMLAILFMNICTPTLDILFQPRILGTGRRQWRRAKLKRRKILRLPTY